jgi:hypothetical protein
MSLAYVERSDVHDMDSLMEYIRQSFGCPVMSRDIVAFRTNAKEFFENNPDLTVADMAVVVDWCRAKQKRPRTLSGIFYFTKDAFAAKVLANRSRSHSERVNDEFYDALSSETDVEWRNWLLAAPTMAARREKLAIWREQRGR